MTLRDALVVVDVEVVVVAQVVDVWPVVVLDVLVDEVVD